MVELINSVDETINPIMMLQDYLKANVEFLPVDKITMPDEPQVTKVKITVTNTAPTDPSPKIVFIGVGLGIAKMGGDSGSVSPDQINFKINRNETPEDDGLFGQNEHTVQFMPKVSYMRMNGVDIPDITEDEKNSGEVLFPGEFIIFEMDIPNSDLPYYQFRLDGTVSRRHLFRHETELPVAEAYIKPLIIKAIQSFNSQDIHKVVKSIIISVPEFGNDTKLSEIRKFIGILSEAEDDCEMLQKGVNELYRQHKFSIFQAHMQRVYTYLDHVKSAIDDLRQAISSSIPERITAEMDKIEIFNEEVVRINQETEALMTKYSLTDEETGYKYRNWEISETA